MKVQAVHGSSKGRHDAVQDGCDNCGMSSVRRIAEPKAGVNVGLKHCSTRRNDRNMCGHSYTVSVLYTVCRESAILCTISYVLILFPHKALHILMPLVCVTVTQDIQPMDTLLYLLTYCDDGEVLAVSPDLGRSRLSSGTSKVCAKRS